MLWQRDDHLVHTIPNHHPTKMDVLPKTLVQIILAANSAAIKYIHQPTSTTFAFFSVLILLQCWTHCKNLVKSTHRWAHFSLGYTIWSIKKTLESVARPLVHKGQQIIMTTFAFSSVSINILWPNRLVLKQTYIHITQVRLNELVRLNSLAR